MQATNGVPLLGGWGGIPQKIFKIEVPRNEFSNILRISKHVIMSHFFI